MREHEVPTHVQAEDRVLLGFTFPQIVAVTAVCAISYGAYRYVPVGPSEVRMALAVVLGLLGIAMIVGKIGGRRLPLVTADLLKYRLGARGHAGPVSQLVRSEPPTSPQPARSGPGPLRLMGKRTKRTLRRLRKKRNRKGDRRNGRMPFRPHGWFGKRRRRADGGQQGHRAETLESTRRSRKGLMAVAVAVLVAAVAAIPPAVMADGHDRWQDEIDFKVAEPVDGRRIFVEGMTVSEERALVTLRAATDVDIRIRAFGGPDGTWIRFSASDRLDQGEIGRYRFPLHGPVPSFTVSWEDGLGQAGAHTVEHDLIPHPLPEIEGDLCNLRMTSLGWAPGVVSGVIESECVTGIEHPVEVQTVTGHQDVTQTTLLEAGVTAITGTLSGGGSIAAVEFIPNGETSFTLPVAAGEAIHPVMVDATLEAVLNIPIPPLTVLTHHPERTEERTETVSLYRPGASDSDSDSKTITVTDENGVTKQHTVSAYAYAYVPATPIPKDVTLTIVHPEHVKAEVVEREPIPGSREESLSLASEIGSDDPYQALVLPEPEPVDPPAEQSSACLI
ncbi:MAG: hypothetical protein F4Y02_03770 [Chloroflexi bacterium]|nr:hypothetical protein [Chloroflexota bacterium]